jgi:hypothetical protein
MLCKHKVTGSNPVSSIAVVGSTDEDPVGHFVNENHLDSRPHGIRAIGAAVAQFLDTEKVACSNHASPIALRFTKPFGQLS